MNPNTPQQENKQQPRQDRRHKPEGQNPGKKPDNTPQNPPIVINLIDLRNMDIKALHAKAKSIGLEYNRQSRQELLFCSQKAPKVY